MLRRYDKMVMYKMTDKGAVRIHVGFSISAFYDDVWIAEREGWQYKIIQDATGKVIVHN